MQSQYHNVPKINGMDQKDGRSFSAKNTTFSADARKLSFSTDIAGAYPEEAQIKKWTRNYQLDRGKKFAIRDNYEFKKVTGDSTTLNLITYCSVSESSPGQLTLSGDDFSLDMKYDSKTMTPKIEYIEVTDNGLKRYWPRGVTRIVFFVKNPGITGKNEIVILPSNK
jgi:hypothetical protein